MQIFPTKDGGIYLQSCITEVQWSIHQHIRVSNHTFLDENVHHNMMCDSVYIKMLGVFETEIKVLNLKIVFGFIWQIEFFFIK